MQAYVRFGDTVCGTLNALLTDGLDSHSWFYYEDKGVGFKTFLNDWIFTTKTHRTRESSEFGSEIRGGSTSASCE